MTSVDQSKPTSEPTAGERTFSYGYAAKAIALVSPLLPALFGTLSLHAYHKGRSDLMMWSIFSIFTALSIYALLESFIARITVSQGGITSFSPWRSKLTFRWDEIDLIRYSKLSGGYVISGPRRKKIYTSEYLSGYGKLIATLLRRIPPERWRHNSLSPGNDD